VCIKTAKVLDLKQPQVWQTAVGQSKFSSLRRDESSVKSKTQTCLDLTTTVVLSLSHTSSSTAGREQPINHDYALPPSRNRIDNNREPDKVTTWSVTPLDTVIRRRRSDPLPS
jgi:hypothetical protein